jgi:cellulose synthase/poly-beta-1,6-N-acetylglucosamine synthase-like glycosyltransferase
MKEPSVDIIIAARNEERFLGSCLDALKAQNYPTELIQVYVIDNSSSDNTARIAVQHGANVSHEPKRGAAAARNLGLGRSNGQLVGFLDAHCIPDQDWVRLMAERCQIDGVGGCQGWIENKSINPHVQRYLNQSGAFSNERVLADTVSGKRNVYPWILGGNCMYRREALIEAGFFSEGLEACEDVDLAWRVVLLGYQLSYVAQAKLVHYDCGSWHAFLKKGIRYGRGAAVLASIYEPHGASEKFVPEQIWSTKPERLLSGLYYWAGYRAMQWQLKLGLKRTPMVRIPRTVLKKFRRAFFWTSKVSLLISNDVIFWFRDDENTSVIIHLPTKLRVVLDLVGDFIWRQLVKGIQRDKLIQNLVTHYGVAHVTARTDLDDFIEELIDVGVLRSVT